MDDRRVARMKPASFKGTRRSFGVVVIAFHDDIAACHNFAEGRPIMWDLFALFIDYQQFTGSDQLHSLAGLDDCVGLGGERGMLWTWLADGDERCRLGQAIPLRDLPSEFALDSLDGCRGWWRACRQHT